ncbi:MAG: hypothetical protein II276_01605, partial [Bacteroidales bacterium]|nr:hypothetical protein [Bacteroidales bacterium]
MKQGATATHFLFYRKKERIMKKALSLLLALVFVLSLCACGSEDSPDTPTVSNTLSTPTEPPAVGSE